jgi:excisionase family DNA binding protein
MPVGLYPGSRGVFAGGPLFFLKPKKIIENRYIKAFGAMGILTQGGGGMETYLTIGELAEYIKLSEQTVRRYVLNRTVPYHKIHKAVRFRVSEIEKWIDGGGLEGAVTAGSEDEGEGDLFAGLEAWEAGTAGGEGEKTGGAV